MIAGVLWISTHFSYTAPPYKFPIYGDRVIAILYYWAIYLHCAEFAAYKLLKLIVLEVLLQLLLKKSQLGQF